MVRDNTRSLPRRRYSFKQHSNTRAGRLGDFTIQKGVDHEIWSPSWNNTFTTVRFFPVPTADNPDVLCGYRMSADENDFDDWIRMYPAIKGWGDPGITCIIYDPSDPNYDSQQNPAWIFFRAIDGAVASGNDRPGWAALLRGAPGRGAQLKKPTQLGFGQGCVMQHKSKPYMPPRGGAPDDKLAILQLSTQAAETFLKMCNEKTLDYAGDPEDYEAAFKYGDPVSLEYGRYVTWYQKGTPPQGTANQPQQRQSVQAAFSQRRQQAGGGGQQRTEDIGYDCLIEPEHAGLSARLIDVPGYADLVRQRTKPWDDLIRIATHSEIINFISGAFPPEMVCYAFADFIDEVPEHVRAAAAGRVSTNVPPNYEVGQSYAGEEDEGAADPAVRQPAGQRRPATTAPSPTGAAAWGRAVAPTTAPQTETQQELGQAVGRNTVVDHSVPDELPTETNATPTPQRRRRPSSAAAAAAREALGG